VAGALRTTKDFDSYAGPMISCDRSVIPGNSACSTDLLFFQVQDDGSIEAITDDGVRRRAAALRSRSERRGAAAGARLDQTARAEPPPVTVGAPT